MGDAAGGDHCRVTTFSPAVAVNEVGAHGAATIAPGEATSGDELGQPESPRAVRDTTPNIARPDINCCQREYIVPSVFMTILLYSYGVLKKHAGTIFKDCVKNNNCF